MTYFVCDVDGCERIFFSDQDREVHWIKAHPESDAAQATILAHQFAADCLN